MFDISWHAATQLSVFLRNFHFRIWAVLDIRVECICVLIIVILSNINA